MTEYVPGDSEQFQVECGTRNTSLMTMTPETVGAGAGEPGSVGGTRGAHPWPLLDAETEKVAILRKNKTTRATTAKCRTSPPTFSSIFPLLQSCGSTQREHNQWTRLVEVLIFYPLFT